MTGFCGCWWAVNSRYAIPITSYTVVLPADANQMSTNTLNKVNVRCRCTVATLCHVKLLRCYVRLCALKMAAYHRKKTKITKQKTMKESLKLSKLDIAVLIQSITLLAEITCHMGSHSVTCHPATRQRWLSRLYTSRSWYSRLSWPGWWLYPEIDGLTSIRNN